MEINNPVVQVQDTKSQDLTRDKIKSFIILFLLLILFVVPISWYLFYLTPKMDDLVSPTPLDLKTYINTNQGYSFSYPATWSLTNTNDPVIKETTTLMNNLNEQISVIVSRNNINPQTTIKTKSILKGDQVSALEDIYVDPTLSGLPYIALSESGPNGKRVYDYYLTSHRDVQLEIYYPGALQMMISNSNQYVNSTWQTYSSIFPWQLTEFDGEKTIYGKFKLSDGSIREIVGNFELDTMSPMGGVAFNYRVVGKGNAYKLMIYLGAQDNLSGVSDMRISTNKNSLENSVWEIYSTTKDIASLYSSDMMNNEDEGIIYVQYRDLAGNLSDVYEDSFVFDAVPPVVYIEVVPNCSDSMDRIVKVLAYDERSDLGNAFEVTNDPLFLDGVQNIVYNRESESFNWVFDDRRVVWVKMSDTSGNIAEPYPAYAATNDQQVENGLCLAESPTPLISHFPSPTMEVLTVSPTKASTTVTPTPSSVELTPTTSPANIPTIDPIVKQQAIGIIDTENLIKFLKYEYSTKEIATIPNSAKYIAQIKYSPKGNLNTYKVVTAFMKDNISYYLVFESSQLTADDAKNNQLDSYKDYKNLLNSFNMTEPETKVEKLF